LTQFFEMQDLTRYWQMCSIECTVVHTWHFYVSL